MESLVSPSYRVPQYESDSHSSVPGSLFVYAPNKAAPVVFAILFGISAVGHIWQC